LTEPRLRRLFRFFATRQDVAWRAAHPDQVIGGGAAQQHGDMLAAEAGRPGYIEPRAEAVHPEVALRDVSQSDEDEANDLTMPGMSEGAFMRSLRYCGPACSVAAVR
jgi:hypothetical protein